MKQKTINERMTNFQILGMIFITFPTIMLYIMGVHRDIVIGVWLGYMITKIAIFSLLELL